MENIDQQYAEALFKKLNKASKRAPEKQKKKLLKLAKMLQAHAPGIYYQKAHPTNARQRQAQAQATRANAQQKEKEQKNVQEQQKKATVRQLIHLQSKKIGITRGNEKNYEPFIAVQKRLESNGKSALHLEKYQFVDVDKQPVNARPAASAINAIEYARRITEINSDTVATAMGQIMKDLQQQQGKKLKLAQLLKVSNDYVGRALLSTIRNYEPIIEILQQGGANKDGRMQKAIESMQRWIQTHASQVSKFLQDGGNLIDVKKDEPNKLLVKTNRNQRGVPLEDILGGYDFFKNVIQAIEQIPSSKEEWKQMLQFVTHFYTQKPYNIDPEKIGRKLRKMDFAFNTNPDRGDITDTTIKQVVSKYSPKEAFEIGASLQDISDYKRQASESIQKLRLHIPRTIDEILRRITGENKQSLGIQEYAKGQIKSLNK